MAQGIPGIQDLESSLPDEQTVLSDEECLKVVIDL